MSITKNDFVKDIFNEGAQPLVVEKGKAYNLIPNMPTYVTEFLIAAGSNLLRNKGNNSLLMQNPKTVKTLVRKMTIESDKKNHFISTLMERGSNALIGKMMLEPRPEHDEFKVHIEQLGSSLKIFVEEYVAKKLIREHPALLSGWVWGRIQLIMEKNEGRTKTYVSEFEPIQLSNPDPTPFVEGRKKIATGDWIDFLIHSMGYDSEELVKNVGNELPEPEKRKAQLRIKLMMLSRLLPLCQPLYNLVELGPRGTGKTSTLRNLSNRVYVIAGAKTTAPKLFQSNLPGRSRPGILQLFKVAVFDEIGVGGDAKFDSEIANLLKEYMESGNISRGSSSVSDCGLFFAGNIDMAPTGNKPVGMYKTWFSVLPETLDDTAFIDRLHGLIPGWELPKLTDKIFARNYGFLADYFGEVLCAFRLDGDFDQFVDDKINIQCKTAEDKVVTPTIRDKKAILKTIAGLLKMIYPHKKFVRKEEEFQAILSLGCELRQHVHNQLVKKQPGEYCAKTFFAEAKT